MFSNLSSWFYGGNVAEKSNDVVTTEPCPDSLIEDDDNFEHQFEQLEPIEVDESDDWVILGKGKNFLLLFMSIK